MTTEIDAEGLRAAWRALNSDDLTEEGEVTREALHSAILAYLATTRTSEAEPVACADCGAKDPFMYPCHQQGCPHSPTPASDDQVEAVREVTAFATAAMAALVAYEADCGEPLPDDHELGRIEDSRGSPSFRIRVGHIRRLAAMGSTKP